MCRRTCRRKLARLRTVCARPRRDRSDGGCPDVRSRRRPLWKCRRLDSQRVDMDEQDVPEREQHDRRRQRQMQQQPAFH